eukprot:scaffold12151_cov107-Isochrysis_galbana.AAC.1
MEGVLSPSCEQFAKRGGRLVRLVGGGSRIVPILITRNKPPGRTTTPFLLANFIFGRDRSLSRWASSCRVTGGGYSEKGSGVILILMISHPNHKPGGLLWAR